MDAQISAWSVVVALYNREASITTPGATVLRRRLSLRESLEGRGQQMDCAAASPWARSRRASSALLEKGAILSLV